MSWSGQYGRSGLSCLSLVDRQSDIERQTFTAAVNVCVWLWGGGRKRDGVAASAAAVTMRSIDPAECFCVRNDRLVHTLGRRLALFIFSQQQGT